MHQHPRPSPVSASPAKSPRTNPTRTNNPREQDIGAQRPGSERGPHDHQTLKHDHLSVPLFESHDDVLEEFVFDPIDSPAGSLSIVATYRSYCDFRIDDSEAFLSSRFMGMDEDYFEPSLRRRQGVDRQQRDDSTRGATEVGSLPYNKRDVAQPDQGQAYGSMSTFHQMGPPASTSPLSALRAARVAGSESPEDMMPKKAPANTRSAQGNDRDPTTGAIDIPNSPRPFHPSYRRSSSAAHQARTAQFEDDDMFPFGMRSASLGVDDDRPPLSLSALAGIQSEVHDESAVAVPSVENRDSAFGPMFNPSVGDNIPIERQTSHERREEGSSLPARPVYRPRMGRGSGRGSTPPQGSSSSLLDRGSGSGASSDHRGGRLSFTRPPSNYEDDEPLLFAMSDLSAVQQSRRSLEEARGGADSVGSSRRGSRRGGY
ncbi:hypothetical protein P7C71_g4371, partial [Lecanoromycetidae sp. Uapishka_2]